MEYIVFVYKNESGEGLVAVAPDVEDSIAYGNTFEEIAEAIEDIVELTLEDEELPPANSLEYFTDEVLHELSIPLSSSRCILTVIEEDTLSYEVKLTGSLEEDKKDLQGRATTYTVYLAGEIHSNWRENIIEGAKELGIKFLTPEYDHESSDKIGKKVVGEQGSDFYNDSVSAKINSMRNHTSIKHSDIVIVKFGENYKQWNAAFDAGYAYALDKKLIIIHPEEFNHSLKEIDAAASAVVELESQAIEILKHLVR